MPTFLKPHHRDHTVPASVREATRHLPTIINGFGKIGTIEFKRDKNAPGSKNVIGSTWSPWTYHTNDPEKIAHLRGLGFIEIPD